MASGDQYTRKAVRQDVHGQVFQEAGGLEWVASMVFPNLPLDAGSTGGWTDEGSLSLGARPQLPSVLGSTLYLASILTTPSIISEFHGPNLS